MKMANFKVYGNLKLERSLLKTRNKIRSKFREVTITIYLILHLVIIFILGDSTAFAPDENDYVDAFKQIYSTKYNNEQLAGWGSEKSIYLKIIYSPAWILNNITKDELLAIRLYSTILVTIALYLILKLINRQYLKSILKNILLTMIFFMPSLLIWGSLALRESFIYFFLVLIYFSLTKIIEKKNFKQNYILLFIGAYGLLLTKSYLFMILLISYVAYILRNKKQVREFKIVSIILVLPLLTNPILFQQIKGNLQYYLKDNNGNVISSAISATTSPIQPTPSTSPDLSLSLGRTSIELRNQIEFNARLKLFLQKIPIIENVFSSSQLLRDETSLKIRTWIPPRFNDFEGILQASLRVLFLPMPFKDNGSFFLNLLTIEWPIWIGLYLLAFVNFYSARKCLDTSGFIVKISRNFSLLLLLQSIFFEINMGTNYRHRTVLLLIVLLADISIFRLKNNRFQKIQEST